MGLGFGAEELGCKGAWLGELGAAITVAKGGVLVGGLVGGLVQCERGGGVCGGCFLSLLLLLVWYRGWMLDREFAGEGLDAEAVELVLGLW